MTNENACGVVWYIRRELGKEKPRETACVRAPACVSEFPACAGVCVLGEEENRGGREGEGVDAWNVQERKRSGGRREREKCACI